MSRIRLSKRSYLPWSLDARWLSKALSLVVLFAITFCATTFVDRSACLAQDNPKSQHPWDFSLVEFDPKDPVSVEKLLGPFREKSQKWTQDVDQLSLNNRADGSKDHVLFLGSSSFRLWESIQQDLEPLQVVRRAYGGARYRDLAIHAPRLVEGLEFSKAVVFIANDITGSQQEDVDPQTVSQLARLVIKQLRDQQPDCQIHLLAVTPTPSRYEHWQKIQVVNQALRKISETTAGVFYIPTAYAFLDRDGQPRAELFQEDRLHLNPTGYQIWAKIILGAIETADQVSR